MSLDDSAAMPYVAAEFPGLFDDWSWRVPKNHTPLLMGKFGDTVFGHPDGSLWLLDMLAGEYERIAASSAEFNLKKNRRKYMDRWFMWSWVEIAYAHGKIPNERECLGWELPPILGGPVDAAHLAVYGRNMYVSLQGQLHRQIRTE